MISSLESGEAFLTPEVKLAILLACEENLTQTSNLLQNVQDLEKFVNPPELQSTDHSFILLLIIFIIIDTRLASWSLTHFTYFLFLAIPSVLNKLAPIEALHLDQKEAASKIGAEVEQHIQTYNSIVSLNTSTYTTIQVDDYIDTKKVNLLSQKFVYWDHMLNLWEQTLDKK